MFKDHLEAISQNHSSSVSYAARTLDALDYTDRMRWTPLELAILSKLTKYPRSMTPRERYIKLTTIRTFLVSVVLLLVGFAVAFAGDSTASPVPVATGAVLFILGYGLGAITSILVIIIDFMYGWD